VDGQSSPKTRLQQSPTFAAQYQLAAQVWFGADQYLLIVLCGPLHLVVQQTTE